MMELTGGFEQLDGLYESLYKGFQQWLRDYKVHKLETQSKEDRKDRVSLEGSKPEDEDPQDILSDGEEEDAEDPETGAGTRAVPQPWKTRRVLRTKPDKPILWKGYAQSFEPAKMSTHISAQELEQWLRQWDALKNASAFSYQIDHIKISYLCEFVD